MNRPDYVQQPSGETPAQAFLAAICGIALLIVVLLCVSFISAQARSSTAAAHAAMAGPVCPDYGTNMHSCEN